MMATMHCSEPQALFVQCNGAGTSVKRVKTSSASPSKPPVLKFCPWCGCGFKRRQELERHILSLHLPCYMYCPGATCTWRGTRKEELRKHMDKGQCLSLEEEKHEQYMIYEPKLILACIFEDTGTVTPSISKLEVATMYALAFVAERAMELQKTEMWEDLWGRPVTVKSGVTVADI